MARDVSKVMQAAADKGRTAVQRIGLREHSVTLVSVTRANFDPDIGGNSGTASEALTVISPRPKVEVVSLARVNASAGVLLAGDIILKELTRNEDYEELIRNPDTIWRVAGPNVNGDFTSIGGTLKMETTKWQVSLRKRQDGPT